MPADHIKKAISLLPAKAPGVLKEFLAAFYSRIPKEDVEALPPALMAETARRHWEMSAARPPGKPAISIYTTTLDKDNPGVGTTVIDIVNDDMAFLVDSVAAEIGRYNRLIHLLLHPILYASFKGRALAAIGAGADEKALRQSHMHIHLQGVMAENLIAQLGHDLYQVLADVRAATRDWLPMKGKLMECREMLDNAPRTHSADEIGEYKSFLEYLHKDNFTLLGYREYKFSEKNGAVVSKTVKGGGLGLLHDDLMPVYIRDGQQELADDLQRLRRKLPPLFVAKVNKRSTVHRPVPLDMVAVKQFDESGNVAGECLFIGLFTSVTYSRSIQDIPLLRRKAQRALEQSEFKHGSHNYKALRHILEKYPRDELFQLKADQILQLGLGILRLQERQRIALFTRQDPFRRYVSCLVYVPKDRYETRLRVLMQRILEDELGGACSDFQVNLDDSVLARVLYVISVKQKKFPSFDAARVERRLQEAGRTWEERLTEALLLSGADEKEVAETMQRYGEAFPTGYREAYAAKQAVFDIARIGDAANTERLVLDLYRCKECGPRQVRLKVYNKGAPVPLSDILPLLENMGLQVLSELPFEVRPAGLGHTVWVHDFMMVTAQDYGPAELEQAKPLFEEALSRIWYGQMANDGLNRLILAARMGWRDIMILRAYVHYLKQARYPLGVRFIEKTLYTHAVISGHIVALFKALLDPSAHDDYESQAAGHALAIDHALDKVDSLEEDRVLRSIVSVVNATLRTNFFQRGRDGNFKAYLAIKLDSRAIADLPQPRPYREIYVYSPRVEGIHLRGDVIARGGIRWSDRFEDFRTEILGLMKAQQVKNSLIVPMGAKGGFIVKKPPAEGGRAAYLQEGIECYKLFIRSLLELTDNLQKGEIIPPPDVVRRDGDDPYLVVAADKGTASFSDIANALSVEFNFWLGDAFASGGSAGYDHKKMGITARGAWESVKRHFRELGRNIQEQPFDVVGVGDMGGDVFGNGMLLSRKTRLLGAFNHLHIFCDPDPDPETSFKERERLFKAVAGWDQYDVKKLSKGGRIYARSEKSLQLTPEIMARFGLDRERVTPSELVQAMLTAEIDLLWFGGIGTFIKASHESHADVGDKANDYLRVNANKVRAKVIGEGANLAITQQARIQYAQGGGRLNADFIDNSGGVNSSDVEVNIKILLHDIMADPAHKMSLAKRNRLLESMTGEVSSLVLQNNYQQSQAISLMEKYAVDNLTQHARFIDDLEDHFGLQRELEELPGYEEIEKRQRSGQGLTRPEICVLQAYAKIKLTKDLLNTNIPDIPEMESYWLFDYFPEPLRRKYIEEIRHHKLRREIIATNLSTSVINRMGLTFVKDMMDKTGATWADVVKAYIVVREAFDLRQLWTAIEALDNKVPAQVQLEAMAAIARMADRETLWFLTRLGRPIDISGDIRSFRKGIKVLRENMPDVVPETLGTIMAARRQEYIAEGLPEELAAQLSLVPPLGAACDITRISVDHRTDILLTAQIYFELGDRFHLHWLRQRARRLIADEPKAAEAMHGLIEHFYGCQAGLTVRILEEMQAELRKRKGGREDVVGKWLEIHAPQAAHFESFFADIRRDGRIDMPDLILAEHRLRQLQAGAR